MSVSSLTTELLGGNLYLVRGRAEPGTTIRAGGRETIVAPDGTFQVQISAARGAREIAVEAQDPRGNSSHYKVPLSSRSARG